MTELPEESWANDSYPKEEIAILSYPEDSYPKEESWTMEN